jgi:hypothetical protein
MSTPLVPLAIDSVQSWDDEADVVVAGCQMAIQPER